MIVFKILKWIFLLPILIIAIWAIGRFLFCGPDKNILKITDPLANEIVDYINEHGRPKSLADIPNLSYGIKRCEKLHTKLNDKYDELSEYDEKCFIEAKNRTVEVEIYYYIYNDYIRTIGMHFRDNSHNVKSDYRFTINKVNKKLYLKHSRIDTIHDSFFCKNGYLKVG